MTVVKTKPLSELLPPQYRYAKVAGNQIKLWNFLTPHKTSQCFVIVKDEVIHVKPERLGLALAKIDPYHQKVRWSENPQLAFYEQSMLLKIVSPRLRKLGLQLEYEDDSFQIIGRLETKQLFKLLAYLGFAPSKLWEAIHKQDKTNEE